MDLVCLYAPYPMSHILSVILAGHKLILRCAMTAMSRVLFCLEGVTKIFDHQEKQGTGLMIFSCFDK